MPVLPPVNQIFTALVSTREFTHKALRGMCRAEFGRLCARVANYNRIDAWDHLAPSQGGQDATDSMEMKRCRVAWIELSMFAKAVLRAEKRGVRPAQAYVRAKSRLDRWIHGDKEGLWREVMQESCAREGKRKRVGRNSAEVTEEFVCREAGLGRVGKAIAALVSPGIAADTPKVEKKLGDKFPRREIPVTVSARALPQPAGAEIDDFIRELKKFKSGTGAGPTGLRPQFLKELVGEAGDDPCVAAMFLRAG